MNFYNSIVAVVLSIVSVISVTGVAKADPNRSYVWHKADGSVVHHHGDVTTTMGVGEVKIFAKPHLAKAPKMSLVPLQTAKKAEQQMCPFILQNFHFIGKFWTEEAAQNAFAAYSASLICKEGEVCLIMQAEIMPDPECKILKVASN